MPWMEVSVVDAREEFAQLAMRDDANRRELCRRFEISPTTGYLWLQRYRSGGRTGLEDRSRRPRSSPLQTPAHVEEVVVRLRREHPAWGGRKLRTVLLAKGTKDVPSASTITEILRRHQLLDPEETAAHRAFTRFEAPSPNDLWQMDYKGHFPLVGSGRCHPLTMLDDHTRFDIGLRALADERGPTVKEELVRVFRRYGLPNRILCDNGTPWGCSGLQSRTSLEVWLLHLDVMVIHGRPWHPQTQGKGERFHRTLQRELLSTRSFDTLDQAQAAFDDWRHVYNHIRPHEALGLVPPIARYQPSPRSYPERLPAVEYPQTDLVRVVGSRGTIRLNGLRYHVGEGFNHCPVGLRPTDDPAVYNVFFRHYWVGRLDVRETAAQ
jgi:transposase InsO family protein